MRYLSPASIFKGTLPYPLDKKSIQLGRKRLLADLELSSGDTLDINGRPFTKSDIIDYFDQLQQDDNTLWHNAIAEDKVLIVFLEKANVQNRQKFSDNPLYSDPEFIHWISPYFLTSFTEFAEACFRTNDDDGLRTLLGNPLLMNDHHQEQGWIFITKILTNSISYMTYQRDREKKSIVPASVIGDLSGIMGFGYISLILILPEDRFGPLRDKYAMTMVQASIYVFNRFPQDRAWPVIWIENAGTLAMSPDVKKEIADKLEEVNGITSRQTKQKGKTYYGHLIWVAVIAVKVLATCSLSSSSSYSTAPINFQPATNFQSITDAKRDSILHLLQAGDTVRARFKHKK